MKTKLNNLFWSLISALLGLVGIVSLAAFSTGCDDGGYELVPCTTCGTPDGGAGTGGSAGNDGNLNPGGSGGGDQSPQPNPGCEQVPSYWDLRSFNGCMTSSDLAGAFRMANHQEYTYQGKSFPENSSPEQGEVWYMLAEETDCGPMTLSAVSNSGTVELTAGSEVDWYLIEPAMAELIWTKLHNGNAPSYSDTLSGAFGSLLIDIFECEVTNVTCALKSTIPGGWPTYGGGIVQFQHTGPNATAKGAFCGHMYVVARSH